MPKLGLIGYPLDHSKSAEIFAQKFSSENIEGFSYELFPIKAIKDLNKLLKQEPELLGFNITTPYKKEVLSHLYEIDSDAVEVWAVNTVAVNKFKGRVLLKGYNTDLPAFKQSIEPLLKSNHTKALVLGSGGAANAAKIAFKQLGIEVTQVSRQVRFETTLYDDLDQLTLLNHKIIVNCTPVGTFPKVDNCPRIPYEFITERHLVYDMVYNPEETSFLKKAKEQGAQTKNGLEMLQLQAMKAWDIWTQ